LDELGCCDPRELHDQEQEDCPFDIIHEEHPPNEEELQNKEDES